MEAEETRRSRRARGRVLVVDDDFDARVILQEFLGSHGFEVVPAEDGQEALAILRGPRQFDAIVLDLLMPRMSGYQFVRALKNEPPRIRSVPVIVASAQAPYVFPRAYAVFPKPFPLAELLDAVETVPRGGGPRSR